MASGLHLLCYKAGGNALCHKAGGNALIYKWKKSGGGEGGEGDETKRRITIDVLWDPINWVCEAGDSHLMFGTILCAVNSGQASLISSNVSSVGENTWRYEVTEFPASFEVSMGFSAACIHKKYPEVQATVVANCKTTEQLDTTVQVPQSGSASKTVSIAVDAAGNVSMAG